MDRQTVIFLFKNSDEAKNLPKGTKVGNSELYKINNTNLPISSVDTIKTSVLLQLLRAAILYDNAPRNPYYGWDKILKTSK